LSTAGLVSATAEARLRRIGRATSHSALGRPCGTASGSTPSFRTSRTAQA
jgi:hypothetical protein